MYSTIRDPGPDLAPEKPDLLPEKMDDSLEGDVQAQVWGVLATLYPHHDLAERRRDSRYPFPYLVHLTPVADDGITPNGETVVVVGKHLSERGLGFYHHRPLPHRRMIVSLETPGGQWIGFLVDLSWCRFTKQGWYESGGRFLKSVLSPVQSSP